MSGYCAAVVAITRKRWYDKAVVAIAWTSVVIQDVRCGTVGLFTLFVAIMALVWLIDAINAHLAPEGA